MLTVEHSGFTFAKNLRVKASATVPFVINLAWFSEPIFDDCGHYFAASGAINSECPSTADDANRKSFSFRCNYKGVLSVMAIKQTKNNQWCLL